MRSSRWIALVSTVAVTAAAVTGCGGGSSTGDLAAVPASTATVAGETVAPAAPALEPTVAAATQPPTTSGEASPTNDPDPATEPFVATEPPAATTAAAGPFPVTVEHAFGETTIPTEPRRIVAWGWGSADAAIALGRTPVAIPFQAYGGDADGVLPWIRQALEQRGEAVPTVLPDSAEEPPYEEIATAKPDLILAVYSGITKDQYELLSAIAPTVAYPAEAWATPWRDVITTVGRALGDDVGAAALLDDIDAQVAKRAAAHPELAGKTVAMVWDAAGTFYVYKPADPRVEFAETLGLVTAPSVEELATNEATFYFTLSYERLDELDSDILVTFADTQKLSREFLRSSHGRTMAQVRAGAVAEVVGKPFVASVSPPTALSLTWGLDRYVDLLAGAVARAEAS